MLLTPEWLKKTQYPIPNTHSAHPVLKAVEVDPHIDPIVPLPVILPPAGAPPLLGSKEHRRRLPCEKGTSDCNDKNPCTIDSCADDVCVHALDASKDQFGSCEIDGHACTVGKCIDNEGQIQCFEQRREYIAGEFGCQDADECTSDSCIEFPLKKEPGSDKEGNVIPNNEHECVYELATGLLCKIGQGCMQGFCQQSGSGMDPADPFVVSCVADEEAPIDCPATGNQCTISVCDATLGCIIENLPANTPCLDNICVTNGACDGAGACVGTPIDIDAACGPSPSSCQGFACDSTLGCVLTKDINEGLACHSGDPCIEGETCSAGVCGAGTQVICPTDGNVCTSDTCKSGLGCIYEPVPNDCSDNNHCTTQDSCVDGVCVGESITCATDPENPCQVGFCDATVGCQVVNLSGAYGADCTTPYPGICANGKLMCLEGQLTTMCEPVVRPGDKDAFCFSDQDNNCDGVPDIDKNNCNCPLPPITSTYRYVDPRGSDTANNCTNASAPCKTITYAIEQAAAGDALVLAAGTFNERNITVGKDLYIYGQGAGVSIVDAGQFGRVFLVNTDINASFCGITVTGGKLGVGQFGGGINSFGNTTITSSTISGNFSPNAGGGIFISSGSTKINISTISGNTSLSGGGIYIFGGSMMISNSTISGNSSPNSFGGGIRVSNSSATISNSTISGNTSHSGGGIYISGGSTKISNSTITNNSSSNGGSLYSSSGTIIAIDHTIIAAQSSGIDCQVGSVISGTFNLNKYGTCNGSGFTRFSGFSLPPLADNGGPTKTHALIPGLTGAGHEAIDAGSTNCNISLDQRGKTRPVDYPGIAPDGTAHCDIGAFELQPPL